MNIFIIFSLLNMHLATQPAHAQIDPLPPLIVAHQHSGHVTPPGAFLNHCDLWTDGKLLGYNRAYRLSSGEWKFDVAINETITQEELIKVSGWVQQAQNGPFEKVPTRCDGGGITILGNPGVTPYNVLYLPDCGTNDSQINTHRAAKMLVEYVKAKCHFR